MTPLRPWMKIALRLAIAFNVVLGVMLIAFYHEGCIWLRFPKPAIVWPLQLIGGVAWFCAISYRLALRGPTKFRDLLALNFVLHGMASAILAYGISDHRLSLNFLPLLLAIVAVDLLPVARILPALFALPGNGDLKVERPTDKAASWKLDSTRTHLRSTPLRLLSLALLATAFLPPSWAVAHLASDAEARWAAQRRPAKWQPLAANLPTKPSDELPYATVDAWPQLRFTDPTSICQIPDGSGRMAVTERAGRVRMFNLKSAASGSKTEPAQVFLDISDRTMQVPHRAEDGLLCLAFHPHFADAASPQRGWLFVRYTANIKGQRMNRLSRFIVPPGADRADPKSETVLIELPEKTVVHKGGGLAFGLDGFQYATFGTDGEVIPNDHAQRIDEALWAGVLRLDVDCRGGEISHTPPRQPSVGKTANYFIPNDNPFVGMPRAMEEFYSIGFRNPWRMTVDRQTGQIWVGDVGDRRREEIDICTKGSNHQWDYMEGTLPTKAYAPQAPGRPEHLLGVETPPVYEYPHDGLNHCIIGGYVYRGKKLPELFGKYIYADQGGRIYALTVDADNHFVSNQLIAGITSDGLGASSWGEDAEGELYLC
ncbi:MAG TPA: PQQ-dependent sugar dehydrogenase, partial [Pirellulales bacterium]